MCRRKFEALDPTYSVEMLYYLLVPLNGFVRTLARAIQFLCQMFTNKR